MTASLTATSELDHLDLAAAHARKAAGSAWRRGGEGAGGAGLDFREEEGLKLSSENKK